MRSGQVESRVARLETAARIKRGQVDAKEIAERAAALSPEQRRARIIALIERQVPAGATMEERVEAVRRITKKYGSNLETTVDTLSRIYQCRPNG